MYQLLITETCMHVMFNLILNTAHTHTHTLTSFTCLVYSSGTNIVIRIPVPKNTQRYVYGFTSVEVMFLVDPGRGSDSIYSGRLLVGL